MKPKFIKQGCPYLIHTFMTPSGENVYSYGTMFWQHKNIYQVHPDDIIKELGEHSNTADFPNCKDVQIRWLGRLAEDPFWKRPKNIPKDWELHLYSAIQLI